MNTDMSLMPADPNIQFGSGIHDPNDLRDSARLVLEALAARLVLEVLAVRLVLEVLAVRLVLEALAVRLVLGSEVHLSVDY